ncbi:MAG TPA: recombinase family protein [Gemmataceae bacterium]|jgi:DNA invertase Pin-like site-specific DNA recombinase|nr:recombinase family protein [Gemmataceae bacterium]
MSASEAIQPLHLSRLALVYVRQSSPHQVLVNQESLKLQYDLQHRACAAGWDAGQVRVIDSDLGRSGRTADGRRGFQDVVSLVNQEQVGILFAYDVTRLARNCTDWYHLLDLCGFRCCLVGDQDGIYDPATPNGRLILGLKGLIAELELHTLRARLTAGLLNKAQRGELALALPVGLVRDALGRVLKHPDQEVQHRLQLVFTSFLQVKAACQVVRFFNDRDLLLPRKGRFGDLVWRPPTVPAILSILKNPAYAGAFVYGRTRAVPRASAPHQRVQKPLPMDQWKVCHRDKYPAYIAWDTFETIQAMVRDNHSEYDRNKTRGVPRPGKALLHGIVYCGACGHKMVVQYKGRPCYLCNYLRQQYQVPVCQNLPADPIDAHVVGAFLQALSPVELDLYGKAVAALRQDEEQVRQAQQQQIERLRYQARLAERQYHQTDPDNRLVAAELERRWEAALRDLKAAEERLQLEQQQPRAAEAFSPEERAAFLQAGKKIPELWRQGRLTPQQQKAFLRCLIDKVVVHRSAPDTLQVRIVWRGGDTTAATLPVTVGSLARLSGAKEMEKEILKLAKEGKSDEEIAALLTQQGHRSPKHTTVLPSTVRILRLRHRLFRQRSQSHPRRIPGHLTVPQLAHTLGITRHWIYDRIHNGTIQVARDPQTTLYLFPDQPKTMNLVKQLRAGKVQSLRF